MRDDELRKLIAEEWDRYMRLVYAPMDLEKLYREMIDAFWKRADDGGRQ